MVISLSFSLIASNLFDYVYKVSHIKRFFTIMPETEQIIIGQTIILCEA